MKLKELTMVVLMLSTFAFGQSRELVPTSKTSFVYVDKQGHRKNISMRGRNFIFVSVREEDSDGRIYAVDRDGTVWLSGGISSGEEVTFTPSGVWDVKYKKRFYASKKYPEADGSNNMNYSLFFTNNGHALHQGSINSTSHGCIHVKTHDIKRIFQWAGVGMPVLISRHNYIEFARGGLKKIYMTKRKHRRKMRGR